MKTNNGRRAFALAMTASILSFQMMPAYALPVAPAPAQQGGGAANLNLSSTARSETSGLASGQVAVIHVGGATRTVGAGSVLTPAELVALTQIMSSGRQALNLNTLGGAIGGTMSLPAAAGHNLSSLVIPAGVSLTNNAAGLNVAGNVVNSGVLAFIAQPNELINSLIATNILNNAGALISSPTSINIEASQSIANHGRIQSGGDIGLRFGTSLTNSGTVSSTNGNINLSSTAGDTMVVNNQGGVFEALNGSINVRDALYTGAQNTTLLGGNWLSNNLSIWSGKGAVNVNVHDVTGIVNIDACIAHVTSNTDNLRIGAMNITGDPTYFNTGDITLTNSISTGGAALAIIAGGNILSSSSAVSLDTSGTVGGDLTLVAGARFTISPITAPTTPDTSGSGDTSTLLTLLGASGTGGRIDFTPNTSNTAISIDTTGSGGNGGNVTMVAFAGTNASSGTINLTSPGPSSSIVPATISTSGSGTNLNGNVMMFADNSITMGSVTANGATGGAGSIVAAVGRTVVNGVTIIDGAITAGSIALSSLGSGAISVPTGAALSTDLGAVVLRTGGAINVNGNITTQGFAPVVAIVVPPAIADVYDFGSLLGVHNGGSISITSGTQLAFGNGVALNASSSASGRDGGEISLSSQTLQMPATGQVALSANSTNGFVASSGTFYGGNGGSVSIRTTSNTAASAINIGSANGNFTVAAQGDSGGGNGGNLLLSSGTNINIDTTTSTNLQLAPQAGSNSQPNATGGGGTNVLVGTGHGANIRLVAGTAASGTVFVNGQLNADGAASSLVPGTAGNPNGDGGSIDITINAKTPFFVGGATSTAPNGTTGIITANGNIATGTNVSAGGAGGSVSIKNVGTGGIIVNNTGTNANVPGATASIEVQAGNAVDAQAPTVEYSAGQGGSIFLAASKGDVLINGGIDASGGAGTNTMSSGNGGTVRIDLNSTNQFTLNTALPATAKSGVNGAITAQGNIGGTPGSPAPATSISTTSNGNGGTIIINNQNGTAATGGISVGSNTLAVTAADANATRQTFGGDGGTIVLNSPAGPVIVNDSINVQGGAADGTPGGGPIPFPFVGVNGGSGGTIKIVAGSSSAFVIGGTATKNGVQGTLNADGYSGGVISVTSNSPAGITVASNSISAQANVAGITNSNMDGGNGGRIALTAPKGPVLVNGNINVDGSTGSAIGSSLGFNTGGNGGTIAITSNSAKPFMIGAATTNGITGTLSAQGGQGLSQSGDGGTISVINIGKGGINAASNSINVSAPAATGPSSPTPTALSQAGNGGNISLQALGGDLIVAGSLNASGGASYTNTSTAAGQTSFQAGNGGTITLVTNSSQNFDIGAAASGAPGIGGAVTANGYIGGNVTVSNLGKGGITVETSGITVTAGNADPTIVGSGSLNNFNGGKGGNISISSPSGPVLVKGNLDVSGGAGVDSALGVPAPNTQTATGFSPVPAGSLDVVFNIADTTQFQLGQTVFLAADSNQTGVIEAINPGVSVTIYFVDQAINTAPDITAYMQGGNGGQIAIVSGGTTPFVVGSGATTNGVLGTLTANGASAGTISLTNTGKGMTITPSSLSQVPTQGTLVTPGGNGGNIYLTSTGTGGVVINGSLNVDGAPQPASNTPFTSGDGGNIAVTTNSSTAFSVTNATNPTNGITGGFSAGGYNAGSIGIKNTGSGGIIITPNTTNFALTALADGGAIDLQAGKGNITVNGSGVLAANAGAGLEGNGGQITLGANSIVTTTTKVLALSAMGDSQTGNLGTGGLVSITQTASKGVLTLGRLSKSIVINVDGSPASGNGGTIMVSAPGGILVNGTLSSSENSAPFTGTVSLKTQGASTITNTSGTIGGGLLQLSSGTGNLGTGPNQNDLNTAVGSLQFNTLGGSVFITNVGDLTLLGSSIGGTPKTPTVVITNSGTASGLSINGFITTPNASVQLTETGTTSGGISINANINAGTIQLTSIGQATTGGGISQTSGLLSATAKGGIQLEAGAGGISSLNTATSAINVTISGTDTSVSPDVVINNTGNLSFTTTPIKAAADINNLTITNSGAMTVGSITNATNVLLSNAGNAAYTMALTGPLGAGNTGASSVQLTAGGSITQTGTTAILQANTVSVGSSWGNVGSPAAPIKLDTSNLSVNDVTSGTHVAYGGVYLSANSNLTLITGLTGGDFVLNSTGNIAVDLTDPSNGFASNYGSITLSSTSGDISVAATNTITALGGPVLISTTGNMSLGDNVTLSGQGRVIDGTAFDFTSGVALFSGAFPTTPTNTTAPTNVTVNGAGTFNSYFGSAGLPNVGSLTVDVSGANVVFNSGNITIGNGVNINATGVTNVISSLDLSNKTVIQNLTALQTAGNVGIGGNLAQKTITFTVPTVSLVNLQAFVVPTGYTVTFNDFTDTTPISVLTDSATGAKNASIAGKVNFISSTGSTALMSIDSKVTGTALTVGGTLSSDLNLILTVSGSTVLSGKVNAGNDLTFGQLVMGTGMATPVTQGVPGALTLSGVIAAGGPLAFGQASLAAAGGFPSIKNLAASQINLYLGGVNSGSSAASTLTATGINAGFLGIEAGSGSTITITNTGKTSVASLSLLTDYSPVTVTQSAAPLALQGSTLGVLKVTANGMKLANALSCGSCTLTTPSLVSDQTLSTTDVNGTVTITTTGTSFSLSGTDNGSGLVVSNNGITVGKSTATASISNFDLNNLAGSLLVSGKTIAFDNALLNSGTASATYFSGPLAPTDVANVGTVQVTSAGAIAGSVTATSIGSNVDIVSNGKGAITLISTLSANGGSVNLRAGGPIDVSGSMLTANALGTTSTNAVGGKITLTAGVTVLGSATPELFSNPGTVPQNPLFLQPSGTLAPLGSNVQVNTDNQGLTAPAGVILTTVATNATLNLATNSTAVLNTSSGGTISLTLGAGSSITAEGTQFTTNSYSPIAAHSANGMRLMNPSNDVTINTDLAEVRAKKGALFTMTRTTNGLRVVACGTAGEVTVTAGGAPIKLASGEEVVVSKRALTATEQGDADGVGRRHFREHAAGAGLHVYTCEVSLVSILSTPEMASLKSPRTTAERRAAEKLLRAAAAISVVTSHHGPYFAQARKNASAEVYKAVSYSK